MSHRQSGSPSVLVTMVMAMVMVMVMGIVTPITDAAVGKFGGGEQEVRNPLAHQRVFCFHQ
jgi:hypothetical protein